MANSVLTQIKAKEERTQETPRTWEIKREPDDRNAVTFTHTFESKDQAVAVHRMLGHQVQQLRAQAAEESQSHLPYLADVLEDYSRILQSMQEKIENSINQ
tara:strand:- start:161 stop:463 length:303 start_codon:yes stop_codon:yes gene_type:complete